jgi:WD40 repeat protein
VGAISRDGRTVAFNDGGGRVVVVDVSSQRECIFGPYSGEGEIGTETLSDDGSRLALATVLGVIRIVDLTTGEDRLVGRHDDRVFTLTFSHDGRTLASGGRDTVLKLWDVAGSGLAAARNEHRGWIWDIAFSRDDRAFATASTDGTVRIWDRASLASRALDGHAGPINSVDFSPDGSRVISAGLDGTIRTWSIATGEGDVLRRVPRVAFELRYSEDGTAISYSSAGGVTVLDPQVPSLSFDTFGSWLAETTTAAIDESGRVAGTK